MNANVDTEDCQALSAIDEVESPRKRMRLDSSGRKSWSMMDRKTDTEVLQEMGVSVLDQDDSETPCESSSATKSLKRKHDIENVNPNINGVTSPRSRYSPKIAKTKCSPSPGPSRSPRSLEKAKPLQDVLESSLIQEYHIDEDTPLAQIYGGYGAYIASSGTKGNASTRLGLEEQEILARKEKFEPSGADTFTLLSDEMILSVFKWLPKRTLAHCMTVCKRWYRVACDETLWQRLDLGNKTLSKDALGRILCRKPIILRLASSEIGDWIPQTITTTRIQYLDLSMSAISRQTLAKLVEHCPSLRKLSLESLPLDDGIMALIGQCSSLETLNLTMAQGITPEGLKSLLDGCTCLQSLNISWCNLNEEALNILVTCLPSKLQRLNLSGARIMNDETVSQLAVRCPRLLELDLSDCPLLGRAALNALLPLSRLEHLALSRCYLLPPHALTKLSSMTALQYLEVWGMLPAISLSALRAATPHIQINQFMFSAIARPTVGARRTSIWGLRTRD
ncbi:S-phase kinase-associated protein 2-like isoform X2 [Colias croceus]|uniref:S-phase kinase-associated protein 2-like isoform X1 n=1 Tax=Colias crocea TaxID=72248 RepID=UPI001E280307|nr:S-phase kinase-associated protein 2-like isoform X1 [Colias croceus]XP_045508925.1 S-phase kinase-associated protein 2-like isoform X2 [Colias croceus]